MNIKNFESNNYIHNNGLKALVQGVLILFTNDILQSKINLNTNLQAITAKATRHRIIDICSLYNPLQGSINENDYNNLIQLLKPFIIQGDLNNQDIIWGSKTKKKHRIFERIINV